MKLQVVKIQEEELIKTHPIRGKALGWFFKLTETSNGAWKVEGADVWGRKVVMTGYNENELLKTAEFEAIRINEETRSS